MFHHLGDHFNKLGDQQPGAGGGVASPMSQPQGVIPTPQRGGADLTVRSSSNPHQATARDEARMQEILSDPEIREVLVDPSIQQLFQTLRTNPAAGQRWEDNFSQLTLHINFIYHMLP